MFFTLLSSLFLNAAIINYDPIGDNHNKNPVISSIIHKKGIEIIKGADRSTDYPEWAKPDLDYKHQDLSYWVQEVLPYKEDRLKNAYIVYPKMGVILPVEQISSKDKALIRAKQSFDHYKYLINGSLHYLGNSPSKGKGNMVIAAHSAYYAKDNGRYKTAFQAVVLSDIGDKIWYFEKTTDGSYIRYDYVIEESKQIKTSDTSIPFPTKDERQLTTYTCYPFGSIANRWYNKSSLVGKTSGFSSEIAKEKDSSIYTYHSISSLNEHSGESYTPKLNIKAEEYALGTIQIALHTINKANN